MTTIPAEVILDFFKKLSAADLRYVIIKNISDELPCYLKDGKDIDILVHESDIRQFEEFMQANNFDAHTPPLGRENGWNFAYQLPEYQFWKYKEDRYTFYIDASFKLSCKSLTPRTWIPLDRCINDDIWEKRVYDSLNHWWIMDDETILIYLLVRSIFDKREFREGYMEGIEARKSLLNHADVRHKLSKIFFNYSDLLIEQIMSGNYSNVIRNYFTFTDY